MSTVRSVSPAHVPAPPMAMTRVLPPSAMSGIRTPKSAIQPLGWAQIPGGASFVAASPDGSIWVLSSLGGGPDRPIWHYTDGSWTNIPGAATRMAVAPDNTLWVINSAGGIYSWNGSAWSTIAGGASDITVGSDGSLYVISNQGGGPFGRGIWHYSGGSWTQLAGAAVRIAASWDTGTYPGGIVPGGVWVTNAAQSIFYYKPGVGFFQVPGAAVALAPTTSGGLFALGYLQNADGSYPIYYDDLSSSWTPLPGAAVSIATDGVHVYAIGVAGGIYVSPVIAPPNVPAGGMGVNWTGNGAFSSQRGTVVAAPSSSGGPAIAFGGAVAFAAAGESATFTVTQPGFTGAFTYFTSTFTGGSGPQCAGNVTVSQTSSNTFLVSQTSSVGETDCAFEIYDAGNANGPAVYFSINGPASLGGVVQ